MKASGLLQFSDNIGGGGVFAMHMWLFCRFVIVSIQDLLYQNQILVNKN